MIETKGAAQRRQILDHLLITGTLTTLHCRDRMSIMHPGGRIKELRKQGWPIVTNWYQQEDASGKEHRAGQYYLQTEKLTPEQKEIQRIVRQDTLD